MFDVLWKMADVIPLPRKMDDGRWLMLLLLIEYEVQALLAVEVEFTI